MLNIVPSTNSIVEFKVDTTLPILNGNFEALKQSLSQHLVKYEIEVNETNFSEAEKMEKKINKLIKQIDGKRKEVASNVKQPIEFFNAKCKELTELCEQSLSKIKEQTVAFKQKRQEEWIELLNAELLSQYTKLSIKDEFKTTSVTDLAIKSNFTDTGSLAKSARDVIGERVHCALSLQNLVHIRLIELENISLKAGLKMPLERRQVEAFLKSDDETYNAGLQKILDSELKRQREIEERTEREYREKLHKESLRIQEEERKKAEIEAQKLFEEKRKQEIAETQNKAEGVQIAKEEGRATQEIIKPTVQKKVNSDGKNTFLITVTCKVITGASADSTKAQFLDALQRAGIKNSIQNATIESVYE